MCHDLKELVKKDFETIYTGEIDEMGYEIIERIPVPKLVGYLCLKTGYYNPDCKTCMLKTEEGWPMSGIVVIETSPTVICKDGNEYPPLCPDNYELEEGIVTGKLIEFLNTKFFLIDA